MPWGRRARRDPPVEPPAGVDRAAAPPPPPLPFEAPGGAFGPLPAPNRLRRELRALARRRETEIRDVGGLAVEMVRRDRFRPDLLVRRANDVLTLEQRLYELDSLLFTHVTARRELRRAPLCRCGAPLIPGAHFCSHCGRPAPGTPPLATCTHCGQPVPADANFCAACGNSVAAAEYARASADVEQTIVRPVPDERAGDA